MHGASAEGGPQSFPTGTPNLGQAQHSTVMLARGTLGDQHSLEGGQGPRTRVWRLQHHVRRGAHAGSGRCGCAVRPDGNTVLHAHHPTQARPPSNTALKHHRLLTADGAITDPSHTSWPGPAPPPPADRGETAAPGPHRAREQTHSSTRLGRAALGQEHETSNTPSSTFQAPVAGLTTKRLTDLLMRLFPETTGQTPGPRPQISATRWEKYWQKTHLRKNCYPIIHTQ